MSIKKEVKMKLKVTKQMTLIGQVTERINIVTGKQIGRAHV